MSIVDTPPLSECQRASVRRPRWVGYTLNTKGQLLGGATIGRDSIHIRGLARHLARKCDLFAVRRPARHICLHRRKSQLMAVGPIGVALPQNPLRIGDVRHPFSTFCKRQSFCRKPGKIRNEPLLLLVESDDLFARRGADEIDPPSVLAGQRGRDPHRSDGELNRRETGLSPEVRFFPHRPDIRVGGLKNEIRSVARPTAAADVRRSAPTREHLPHMAAICSGLPQ